MPKNVEAGCKNFDFEFCLKHFNGKFEILQVVGTCGKVHTYRIVPMYVVNVLCSYQDSTLVL